MTIFIGLTSVLLATLSVDAQTVWHDDPLNPHLQGLSRVLSPSVLVDSSTHLFHLWETDGYRVYHALSPDGRTWYVSENTPSIDLTSAFRVNFIYAVEVVRVDSEYYMYCDAAVTGSFSQIITLATSKDGETWTVHPASPVFIPTGSGWESNGISYPKIVRAEQAYCMLYAGGDGVHGSMIGVATSLDGKTWQRYENNPVIVISGSAPTGLEIHDGQFYLLYTSLIPPASSINLAQSPDGFTWKNSSFNPVIQSGPPGAWNSSNLGEGTLRFVNGSFRLWYSAQSAYDPTWRMGYASTDPRDVMTGTSDLQLHLPRNESLNQNYPNPFNPNTTIGFQVTHSSVVTLRIFDALGREVATLVNEDMKPGNYQRMFSGAGLASGVYFSQLTIGGFQQAKKMLLQR
jgi:predicted GH43/DUF377 family glycosyl hydrolase